MTPNFRPRFMSATHVPSSTERLMNPFYHSQVRLPPYRARYLQRFHPYLRGQSSGWTRDAGDFDFEWDDFLEMVDAFQRLDIDSVPRSNDVYTFPAHAANEEQVEFQQHDGRQAADSNAADAVPVGVETQIIDAVDPQHQSDSIRVVEAENSDIAVPMGGEDNQGGRSLQASLLLFIPAPFDLNLLLAVNHRREMPFPMCSRKLLRQLTP